MCPGLCSYFPMISQLETSFSWGNSPATSGAAVASPSITVRMAHSTIDNQHLHQFHG